MQNAIVVHHYRVRNDDVGISLSRFAVHDDDKLSIDEPHEMISTFRLLPGESYLAKEQQLLCYGHGEFYLDTCYYRIVNNDGKIEISPEIGFK